MVQNYEYRYRENVDKSEAHVFFLEERFLYQEWACTLGGNGNHKVSCETILSRSEEIKAD
jgi:hypothetical protein